MAVLGALVYARLPGGAGGARLGPAQRLAFTAGLHLALWVCGLVLLAVAALVAGLVAVPARRRSRPGEVPAQAQ